MTGAGKKRLAAVLAAVILAGVLSGCGGKLPDEVAADDILTMTPIDSKKITITIRAEYNVNNEAIRSALAAKFPDFNFVSVFHCAQETMYELRQSLKGGTAEDIIISPNMKSVADIAPEYMLDLSGESFAGNYIGSAAESCQINGKLYYLPGPSSLYGIVYDRTMFEEHGWKVPQSYTEFIGLVKTIGASGIRAIQPTCKYARQAQMVLTMFDYDETFGGVDNYKWLVDFQSGKSTMTGHIEPALKRYSELQSAGAIEAGDFDVQPGNRSDMLYTDHSCAMIIENEQAELYAKQKNSDHEYGMMPFWCGDGENSDYLVSMPTYYIGVNAGLAEKGNEKKLAAVKEVLSYISTPQGQLDINGGKLTQMSNFQGTEYTASTFNSDIQATIAKGNLVPEVDLMTSGNANPVEKALRKDLISYLKGDMDAAAVASDCDKVRDAALEDPDNRGEKLGTASENFTCAETGLFIADALREKAGADIGLCYVGTTHCGMVGRIYKGDVCKADVSALSLSVGQTSGDKNDKKLWLVSMTGSQLTDLLKEGYSFDPDDNVPNIPYYVASGLKIKFAPWQEEKLVSVTMADGSELSADKTYTVALWGWPFKDQCQGTVEKVFDESCDDILSAAVAAKGTLAPSNDGSFQIVYD